VGIADRHFSVLGPFTICRLGGATSENGACQLFSGRPGMQPVEDFEDRQLAACAKAKLKEKRLTKAEFLLQ
jgi:hypothetical protein